MAEPLWTSQEIIDATGGRATGGAFAATGVSIDTRSLQPGDLFIALHDQRDGHEFVDQARAAGAAGVLVERPAGGSAVVVDNTQAALESLALAARARATDAKRAAVTGSVGKTSVTQAVAAGLALAGSAHASVRSYNNHIGVPLTLARMPRETRRAVFEIGMNHPGEIEPLSRMVAPDVVAITTVGAVHTENFPDGETGVARAKAEVFAGLAPGAAAILNADDRWFDFLRGEAIRAGARILTFGSTEDADAELLTFTPTADGARVRARIGGENLAFPIRQSGYHWGLNSLAVLLMLGELGVDRPTGLAALSSFAPLEGRGATHQVQLPAGAFTLIDESYNANPISVGAALKTLAVAPTQGRRIVALTDMLELGEDASNRHADLAEPIEAAGVDLVFCAGPLMAALWETLPPARQGGYAPRAEDLAPQIERAIAPGDVVMVKGSKGSKAHAVAESLLSLGAGARKVG